MKNVGIGIVGIGFMGMIHYLAAQRATRGRVVALCSRDQKKLDGDWTSIQGNFGPRGTHMDLSGVARYRDFQALLDDPNVQLVDLCVPNDEHAPLAIRALEAGKHVLVEKPIALRVEDADAMVAAAIAHGKLLMVAHVLPFFPEFRYAAEVLRSGTLGALRAAHLTRVIARPDWSTGIADDRSGGPAIDLHIHDTHFIGLTCGVPRSVRSVGVVERGAVVHLSTQYRYDEPNRAISAVSGALSQKGRPFTHGFEFNLERATLSYWQANLADGPRVSPLCVLHADGTTESPALGSGDPLEAFAAEIAQAVESVESGQAAPEFSADLARLALKICQAEVESVKTGQEIRVGV